MLDLRKLEKELDEALAKETPESLRAWLLGEREKDVMEEINPAKFNAYSLYEFANVELSLVTAVDFAQPSLFYPHEFGHHLNFEGKVDAAFYGNITLYYYNFNTLTVAQVSTKAKSEENTDNNFALAA